MQTVFDCENLKPLLTAQRWILFRHSWSWKKKEEGPGFSTVVMTGGATIPLGTNINTMPGLLPPGSHPWREEDEEGNLYNVVTALCMFTNVSNG